MTLVGRSLELYYIDGRPDGMVTAELFNWTGHVLMAPRTQLAAALGRSESSYAGIYLLLGELDGQPRAYLGEGEDISARIRSHDVNKEWWNQVVLVTASANKLNKAHVRYLEARLISEARGIGRVPLDNAALPSLPSLSEADVAKMEAFIENLLIVLPAVRVDMFIQRARPTTVTAPRSDPADAGLQTAPSPGEEGTSFILDSRKHDLHARAVLLDGEFIVQKGSTARTEWTGRPEHSYAPLHDELVRAGVLIAENGRLRFGQNYAFNSPSAAAAIIYGRSASGPSAWRVEASGLSYKEWESGLLATATLQEAA